MVVAGSLDKDPKNLTYRFQITDGAASIPVYFRGVPPDLFSEGKGAVVEGKFGADGLFKANTIMAKHAEEYSPPTEGDHSEARSFIPAEKANKP
jgi:cytochrome c-type biogenesis protein CcmE